METRAPDMIKHCAYCGHPIAVDSTAPERFGERFCSEGHAEEFATGVRAARTEAAARRQEGAPGNGMACGLPPSGQRGWRYHVKRVVCWGAPVLLLLAIPLIWSGGWAATGGSLLSVVALLACPLGMYFMMRGMMGMQHQQGPAESARKEDGRA
ncbi:MAG: hypothetical protein ACREMB_23205 [Candidatus Rokuibacteriota bacterium]